MPVLLDLFLTFARIGLFTFGGGYAMISIIENTCVETKKWISHDEMMDLTVLAESTPGPIAINAATYIGYRKKKLPGAIIATLGIIIPPFLVIFLISTFLDNFLEILWIAHAFRGIKAAVGLLILDAGINMVRKMKKKPLSITILCVSFIAMLVIDLFSLNFSSIAILLLAAVFGLILYLISKYRTPSRGGAEK